MFVSFLISNIDTSLILNADYSIKISEVKKRGVNVLNNLPCELHLRVIKPNFAP